MSRRGREGRDRREGGVAEPLAEGEVQRGEGRAGPEDAPEARVRDLRRSPARAGIPRGRPRLPGRATLSALCPFAAWVTAHCVCVCGGGAFDPTESLIGLGVKDARLSGESSTLAIACKDGSKKLHFGAMTNRLDSTREFERSAAGGEAGGGI